MTTTMAMEKIDAASLPQNIEAEQALLGALLSNNKAFVYWDFLPYPRVDIWSLD